MKILVTAGPTREYIDPVRYISNASSGRMGYSVAGRAAERGHEVVLLTGPVSRVPPDRVEVVPFGDYRQLGDALEERFPNCDVLVMAAAVSDFYVSDFSVEKVSRSRGPLNITLEPAEDLVARCGEKKSGSQRIVAFAVEGGNREEMEQKARLEMEAKNADFTVVNPPESIDSENSEACILGRGGVLVPWGYRPKAQLADEILNLL